MKINNISLTVFINFIAIALAAPTTTPLQEKSYAVDHISNSLEARGLFDGVASGVSDLVDATLGIPKNTNPGSTSPPGTSDVQPFDTSMDTLNSGMDSPGEGFYGYPDPSEELPQEDDPFGLSDPNMGFDFPSGDLGAGTDPSGAIGKK